MSVPLVIDFTELELEAIDSLFPPDIENDSWTVYHATSSIYEAQIDVEGLRWKPHVCSRDDVESLVAVYKKMCWAGISGGGLSVLLPFTLDGDFQHRERKPLYFREDSLMPLLFATREFAGGETARAVRHALSDLDRYVEDSTVRERHLHSPYTFFDEKLESPVDLDWLATIVADFDKLRTRCNKCLKQHRHGVVYAVRLLPEDLPDLSYSGSMGIRCFKDLPPTRIVAKARIHAEDDAILRLRDSVDMFRRLEKKRLQHDGLLLRMNEAGAG